MRLNNVKLFPFDILQARRFEIIAAKLMDQLSVSVSSNNTTLPSSANNINIVPSTSPKIIKQPSLADFLPSNNLENEQQKIKETDNLHSIKTIVDINRSMDDDADSDALLLDGSRSLKWKKPTESLFLIQHLSRKGLRPRQILSAVYPQYSSSIPDLIPDAWIFQLLRELCEQRTRQKLHQFNSFEDAIELFKRSKRIMVITGAGVSVSCGIPDFRSEHGIYARLKRDFPELPTPTAMFDIDFFRANPKPFYNFAKEIFPGQFPPSLSHIFIKFLEEEGKLLRNYTQNIDTLERVAGISNIVECHGSFASATCLHCGHHVNSDEIREHVFAQRVAHCSKCLEGVMKPDIVFFGEDLGDDFHDQMGLDHSELDLLVVIGSSMQVRPVSLIPYNIASDVPQILINRELLRSYPADIKLLGSCDSILVQISLAMGGGMREKMINEMQKRRSTLQNGKLILPQDLLDRIENISLKKDEELFRPRMVSIEEFKKSINTSEQLKEEPECKKQKLEENEEKSNDYEKLSSGLWEGNYVLVDTHLPSTDSTLLVPPNLNVFVGAELYYDRDQDIFVRRMGIKEQHWDVGNNGSEGDELESYSSQSSSMEASRDERGGSAPPEFEIVQRNNDYHEERKTESCPPPKINDQ